MAKKTRDRDRQQTTARSGNGNGTARQGEGAAPPPPRLHGELLSTTLLAFLRGWNAYGYELTQKIAQAGLPQSDSGTVYRTLRQLERAGLVSSFWDTSESGPARRMYSLTAAGEAFLAGWIDILEHYQRVLRQAAEGFRAMAGGVRRRYDSDDSPTEG